MKPFEIQILVNICIRYGKSLFEYRFESNRDIDLKVIMWFKISILFQIFKMLKKSSQITSPLSSIESLKFSTFNYFGMGAVLTSVSQSFWINFSAYYLNNILPGYGNQIFLAAQIFQGIGILLGWLILAKFATKTFQQTQSNESQSKCKKIFKFNCLQGINLYILLYIIGVFMLMAFLPLVFLLSLTTPVSVLVFSMLAKMGSGFMIISQMTIIPKLTLNRSRRRKLVQKITQYGLAGTFLSMFIMTFVSIYVTFVWKYFIGVCTFSVLGGICSLLYVYKIKEIMRVSGFEQKQKQSQKSKNKSQIIECKSSNSEQNVAEGIIQCSVIKSPRFYIYGLILVLGTLYMDIAVAIFPYFIKSFHNVTQLNYLAAITILYLSSLLCAIATKNSFVFGGIRSIMSIGLVTCIFSTFFLIIALSQRQFGALMIGGACLIGISKVIATNCVLNLINQLIGTKTKGKQFIYGFYYFLERVIAGCVLYAIISKVYLSQDQDLLNFSQIFLPFILYTIAWILILIDRTLIQKFTKSNRILIVQPMKSQNNDQNSIKQQSIREKAKIIVNNERIEHRNIKFKIQSKQYKK